MEGDTAANIGIGMVLTAAGFAYGYRQERINSILQKFDDGSLEDLLTSTPDNSPYSIQNNPETDKNRSSVAIGAGLAGISYISSGTAVNAAAHGIIGGGLYYAGAYLGKRAAAIVPDRKELSFSQRAEMESRLDKWVQASIHDNEQASDMMKDTCAYLIGILKRNPSVNLGNQIVHAIEDAALFVFHYNTFKEHWGSSDVFIGPSSTEGEHALFLIPHEKKLYEMALDSKVCRQADGFAHEEFPACQARYWDGTLDSYVKAYIEESKKGLTIALFSEVLSLEQMQNHAISYFEKTMHNPFRTFTKLVDNEFRGR